MKSRLGAQFRIIEPAEKPVFPAGPQRLLLLAGGVAFGLVMFLAVPLGLYQLNSGFKSKDDLERTTGLPIIGVVPPMDTPDLLYQRRRLTIASLVGMVLSMIGGGYVIFMFV